MLYFRQSCRENQNTHFMLNNPPPPENRAVYEITWKNMVEPDRPQTTWRSRCACWIPKATNTHSEYVALTAFTLPQWWCKPASTLRYTYSACLVSNSGNCKYSTFTHFWPEIAAMIDLNLSHPVVLYKLKQQVNHITQFMFTYNYNLLYFYIGLLQLIQKCMQHDLDRNLERV